MKGNFNQIISSSTPVLVDFYADWCGPCKLQTPILKEVSRKLGEKVRIIKIDVDKNQTTAQRYQIRSIPTIILFKNGQPVWRQSGVADQQQLINIINLNT
jgi:thioredoxin 1